MQRSQNRCDVISPSDTVDNASSYVCYVLDEQLFCVFQLIRHHGVIAELLIQLLIKLMLLLLLLVITICCEDYSGYE